MSIELPDLVQRIRVKTDELRAAEKLVARTGKRFDTLRASTADATDQMDEFSDSTDRANDSLGRTEKVTSGATRALSVLHRSTDDARISMGDAGDEATRLGQAASGAADDVTNLGDAAGGASRDVDALGKSTQETSRDNDTFTRSTKAATGGIGSFIKKVLAAGGVLKILSLALGSLKLSAIVAVIGQLGSGLISAAAGATAFVSAIAPAAGIIGALPAGILAFASSALALKAIFGPASDAVTAINKYGIASDEAREAAAGLSAQNRAFVESYAGFRTVLDSVNAGIRGAGLPGFTSALTQVGTVVRAAKDELTGLGATLGLLAQRGAELVSSGPFSRDLQTILSRNNELVFTLGKAGLQLVSVLRNIMVAAGPMTQALADLALQGARWLNTVVESGRKSGALRAFFADALQVTKQLGRTLADFGVGLFNVFSIGRALGDDLFKTLTKNARVFREWTESASGRSAILDFFNDARPVLAQFGKLVTATFREFFTLQDDINFASTLKQIRTQLLPAVGDAIRYFGKSGLTSAIINAATAFTELFNALPVNPIVEVLNAVSNLTRSLIAVGKANPIILQVIASLLVMRSALKAIAIGGKLTGVTSLISTLRGVGPAGSAGAKGIAGFMQGLRGASGKSKSLSNKIGDGLYRGIAGGVNKVKGLFKRNSLATTIDRSLGRPAGFKAKAGKIATSIKSGLVGGLSKLKGALVSAGKSTAGAFASGFSASKGAISRTVKATGSTLQRGLKATGRGAATAGKGVATAFGKGISAIGGIATKAIGGLGAVFSALKGPILAAAGAVRAFTLALLTNPIFLVVTAIVALGAALYLAYQRSETFRKIVDATFGFIKDVVITAVSTVVNFVRDNWKLIAVLITGPIGIAVALVVRYWDQISGAFSAAVTFIRDLIVRYFTLYRTIITTAFNVYRSIVSRYWNIIRGIFTTVFNVIRGVITRYFTLYRTIITTAFNVIRNVVSAAWNFITDQFQRAVSIVQAIVRVGFALVRRFIVEPIQAVVGIVRQVWDTVVGVFRDSVDRAVDAVSGIRDRILRFFVNAGVWLYDVGRTIIQGLINGITSMFGPLQSTFNWVTDRIPDWKGPIGKDENLLYGAGRAIMSGLVKGIREGSGEVKSVLTSITRGIGATQFAAPQITGQMADMVTSVQNAIAQATGPASRAVDQLKRTSVARSLQSQLQRRAQQAAEEENRLRTKLPLLSGEDRQEAIKRIKELQALQDRLARQSGKVRQVADLRAQRQAALRRADSFAKQAANLRSQLPQLEGEDRRKALAQIARLEEQRKDELQKAKDVQAELISVFRDLPAKIRDLLRQAQDKAQAKRAKEREKDNQGAGGTAAGGSGGDGRRNRNAVAIVASDLFKQARDAARQENRLRAKLPDLTGADRRRARNRILELQAQQERLVRRAGAAQRVAALRRTRTNALDRADQLAARSQRLQAQLPDLKGEERRAAKEEIKRLEKERAAELRKAREAQDRLTKVMKDLPASVRKMVQEVRRQQEKRQERKREERRAEAAGPSGSANDPVYAKLTPKMPDPERKYDKDRPERRSNTKAVRATERAVSRFGKRLPDVTEDTAQASQNVAKRVAAATNGVIADASGKNARDVVKAVREGRGDAKQEGQETRKNARELSAAERQQIKDARAKAAADAAKNRQADRTIEQTSRQVWARQVAAQIKAGQTDTAMMIAAIERIRIEGATTAPVPNAGAGKTPDNKKPPTTEKSTTYNVTVNNPKGETAEDSVTRRLRQQEVLRNRG